MRQLARRGHRRIHAWWNKSSVPEKSRDEFESSPNLSTQKSPSFTLPQVYNDRKMDRCRNR